MTTTDCTEFTKLTIEAYTHGRWAAKHHPVQPLGMAIVVPCCSP